ncbi:Tetratricopeptide repeat-containing protein [Thermodesulfobium acidiphilum]|uniref:Tetratricopeptide repeat-containing protein n=1 Tax=Thermodesulfobium acidiphilum TaxID=1794699 RepID=A0A2R4W056_THEAF|nr:tetratricopeptide repeat protein [Thermodesulfobium acidiphilum]AWB10183.1 Tetratricopeptide repeat-containing protein [Thermodesulfobium acidiphilum]
MLKKTLLILFSILFVFASTSFASVQSDLAKEYFLLGEKYLSESNFDKAKMFFRQAIDTDQTYVQAYDELAKCYIGTNQLSTAIDIASKALSIDPNFTDAMLTKGIALRRLGRNSDAIIILSDAIQKDPSNANIYYNLGLVYSNQHDDLQAIKNYTKAVSLNPNFSDARYQLGLSYLATDDLYNSYLQFRALKDLNSSLANSLFDKIYTIKNLASLYPVNVINDQSVEQLLKNANTAFEKKNYDRAITLYENVLIKAPDNLLASTRLGEIFWKRSDNGLIFQAYKNAIRLDPDNANYHYYVGVALAKLGEKHFAMIEERILKSLNPDLANKLFIEIYKYNY